jgi:DNA-directed RNA polymerase subunit alpha
MQTAIKADQFGEIRQCLVELESRVASGGNERDRIAAGVTSYLMARHAQADRLLSDVSGNGLAEFYHARALLALGRYDDAAARFEQAGRDGANPIECTLARAGAIRLAGRIEEAEELLSSSSRDAVTYADYSYQMGCIREDRGDTLGANEYFERAVDMDPHHSEALFRLANQNNLLGNDDEAIKLYEQSLSTPPFFLGALINLGLLYEDNEQYSAAAFCFRRILDIDPNHARARLFLRDIEASADMYYDEETLRRNRELDQALQVPISDFELSARSRNCLERAGIVTLGDLTRVTEAELLAGKNFGETSLREIRDILDSRGLAIGQSAHQAPPTPVYVTEDLAPEERHKYEMPVTDLNLSVRARKCVTRLGLTTIGELITKSADELLSMRNFGVTSLNEIRAKLSDVGLKLRND